MPDLEVLSARGAPSRSAREPLEHAARSAQRVVVLHTGPGAPLEQLAREFHAASAQAREPLLVLEPAQLEREEASDRPYERVRRGRLALVGLQHAPAALQLRLAQRLRRWRGAPDGAPRVLALFEREPHELQQELSEALNGLSVRVAPLSERREQIEELARAHLRRCGAPSNLLTTSALRLLERLPWTGGERELELWLERAQVLAGSGPIEATHVAPPELAAAPAPNHELPSLPLTDRRLAAVESALIQRVLAEQDGNVSRCAQVLGIHRSTLHAKLRAPRLPG